MRLPRFARNDRFSGIPGTFNLEPSTFNGAVELMKPGAFKLGLNLRNPLCQRMLRRATCLRRRKRLFDKELRNAPKPAYRTNASKDPCKLVKTRRKPLSDNRIILQDGKPVLKSPDETKWRCFRQNPEIIIRNTRRNSCRRERLRLR